MMSSAGARRALRRFHVTPHALDHERVIFAGPEAHHIAHVLRLKSGARLVVFDGAREAEVELEAVGGTEVTARRLGVPAAPRRPVAMSLLQGVARVPKMDLIVRMGTEIGLSAIYPVLTTRSVADPGPARIDRWRRIATEAAKQSGRADLPEVHPVTTLRDALALLGPVDLLLVPWEDEHRPIGVVIANRAFATAGILIGPEGGLTGEEVEIARRADGETVSLGPLILRTETAGLVTAAILLYERLLRA